MARKSAEPTNGKPHPGASLTLDVPEPLKADPFAPLKRLRAAAMIGHVAITAAAAERPEYVWEGIFTADHHVELSGPSYSGKTTLATLLAVARANPTDTPVNVLGRAVAPAAQGQFVIVVEEENSKCSIATNLMAACAALGLPEAETLDRMIVVARAGMKAAPGARPGKVESLWDELHQLGQAGAVGLTVLDSRARIFGGDPNSERDQGDAANQVTILIRATGAPVIVISHTRKSGAETIEDVAGSNQRGAAADTVLLVTAERDEGRILSSRVVFAKLRDSFVGEHPEPVSFSIAKGDDGGWKLGVNASARAEDQPAHERVVAMLARVGKPCTKNEIATALGMNARTIDTALSVAKAEKQVRQTKGKRRGKATDLFEATLSAVDFSTLLADRGPKESDELPY
ncbi:MAG: AAA family ATPase [Deltaproteobacteria bacterium]|nr:AAA family ATPase [Deltaproteobacteria bacterium]